MQKALYDFSSRDTSHGLDDIGIVTLLDREDLTDAHRSFLASFKPGKSGLILAVSEPRQAAELKKASGGTIVCQLVNPMFKTGLREEN